VARHKELFEELHPEARRPAGGRPRKGETVSGFLGRAAEAAGYTERSFQQDVQIATAIRPDVLKAIAGAPLADNKRELLALARVPEEQQSAVAKLILQEGETKVAAAARSLDRRETRRHRQRVAAAQSTASDAWTVENGNCCHVLRARPEAWADLAFADAPFNRGVKYPGYDDNKSVADYLAFSREWMAEVARALRPGGSFYLAMCDEFVGGHHIFRVRPLSNSPVGPQLLYHAMLGGRVASRHDERRRIESW
jgi:hypothetical protein